MWSVAAVKGCKNLGVTQLVVLAIQKSFQFGLMARHARLDVARLSETIYLIYKMPFYCSYKPLLTSEVWPPETDLTVVCPGTLFHLKKKKKKSCHLIFNTFDRIWKSSSSTYRETLRSKRKERKRSRHVWILTPALAPLARLERVQTDCVWWQNSKNNQQLNSNLPRTTLFW